MPLGANKAAIFGVAGVSAADVVLLSSQTADSDASISFTSGITSTYGVYIFKFYNINPETDSAALTFQANAVGASDYDEIMTTTSQAAYHYENGSATNFVYTGGEDQAQGTAYSKLTYETGSGADESCAGELYLFNPASTTYVKHFTSVTNNYGNTNRTIHLHCGGYFNITAAIDDVQFKMSSGDFEGTIKMWGVK